MARSALLTLDDVTQHFTVNGETVAPLQNVSVSIPEHSFTVAVGPSGSGKSTLLNVVSGLQKPALGRMFFGERDLYSLSPDELARFRAQKIGIVYQDNYWVKSLSVIENVALPLAFIGKERGEARVQAKLALDRVGMLSYAKKLPALLSLGEQQRIAAARALVNNPELIIADEPTGNLDSKNGDQVMDLLRQCQQDSQATIILVTHNLEYLPLADTVLQVQDGRVRQLPRSDTKAAVEHLVSEMKSRLARFTKGAAHVAS